MECRKESEPVVLPSLAEFLEDRFPQRLDEHLQGAFGPSMPRVGDNGRYAIVASGRFRGAITADLLAFAHNNRVDGALLLVDEDTERVLFFEEGMLVGAQSNVLFERLGRLLYKAGAVERKAYEKLIEVEEEQGPSGLLDWVPEATLEWAAELRVWEVVAGLYLAGRGHFVLVEGRPQLDGVFEVSLDPMQVALEGMRRHDQWRNRPTDGRPSRSDAVPAAQPITLMRTLEPLRRMRSA